MDPELTGTHVVVGGPNTTGSRSIGIRSFFLTILLCVVVVVVNIVLELPPQASSATFVVSFVGSYAIRRFYTDRNRTVHIDLDRNTITSGKVELTITEITSASTVGAESDSDRSAFEFGQPGRDRVVIYVPRDATKRAVLAEVVRRSSIALPDMANRFDKYDPEGKFATVGVSDRFHTKHSALENFAS
jgi:hypothetical protein